MRYFFLFVLTGVVGLVAYAIVSWPKATDESTASQAIVLANLPERYCPEQVQLLYASNLTAPFPAAVTNCQTIDLDGINLGERDTVYLLLPQALPLSISYSQSVGRYVVSPRVGDVNGDNAIDERDEAIVTDGMFGDVMDGDIDLDGLVTSEDLALVRLNYGVGPKRPDGQEWR
ncbi:MAG: hypothetical protein WEC83_01490 [Patescibacteria group bacterium]